MSGGGSVPWSPYPVQDWGEVPSAGADPQAGPPESAWVNPAWAPPRAPRAAWLPVLVIGLVTCLVAAGFYVADRAGEQGGTTSAQAFVPDDGAVSFTSRTTRTQGSAETSTASYVTESARLTGVTVVLALDVTFGTKVLSGLDPENLTGTPFWRTTTTEIGQPESSQQLVRVYRTAADVELVGESGPGTAHVYRPALVELPADVAAGQTWSGAGSAGDTLTYRSAFRADAAEGGCLRVTGTIAYFATGGQPGSTTAVDKTWCPAAGVTATTTATGGTSEFEAPLSSSAGVRTEDAELRTVSEPVSWKAPQSWRRQDFTCISIDQNFGQERMGGSPSQVPPVLTDSGLVIRGTSANDLVTFTPKTPTSWTSLWRMHPGGTLLTATTFGDVVVATTSLRQVVAYSAAGVRLWQHDLTEPAFRPPQRIDDATLVLADSGGSVRAIDVRTGTLRWQQDVGVEVTTAPVGDPRAVVVFGGDGSANAYRSDTGTPLWRRELDVNRAAVVGDTLVTQNAATLTALSLTTGDSRWLQVVTGTVDDLRTFSGYLVLATQLGTTILTEDGRERARRGPYELVTVTSSHVVGWGVGEAEVLDSDLTPVFTIDTPDRNLASSVLAPLADRFGVYLFAGDWGFSTWAEQP